jgi:hypothetical protein
MQTQKLNGVSLQARFELQTRYQSIREAETNRDKHAALVLLNESVYRHSGDTFDIDDLGQIGVASQSEGESTNDNAGPSRSADLACAYRALWEKTPQNLLFEEDGLVDEYLSSLVASVLPGNPSDYSGGPYEELSQGRVLSKLYQSEIRLVDALFDFQTRHHGWRIFAEQEIGISLEEFLKISMTDPDDGNGPVLRNDIPPVTELLTENTITLHQQCECAESEPALDDFGGAGEEMQDFEARAQRFAEGMAKAADFY